ncbi:MAG: MFS transporter [Leptospiraceae bacterium]|nr:MFS transporter [Leptospiraceae bacterium]
MAKYKKGAYSWAMYDWANSAWATTVLAGFYPVFFTKFWAADLPSYDKVAYLGYANSAAALSVFLLAAFVGAISDKGNRKKRMIATFAGMGIVLTGCLFWVARGEWLLAAVIYSLSYVFWLLANISYDSLIVSVSDEQDVDRVSGLGYALGYLGGGLLFFINVMMVQQPQLFNLVDAQIANLSSQIEGQQLVMRADLKGSLDSPGFAADKVEKSHDAAMQRAALLEANQAYDEAFLLYRQLQLKLNPQDENYALDKGRLDLLMARTLERNGQSELVSERYNAAVNSYASAAGIERAPLLEADARVAYARWLLVSGQREAAVSQLENSMELRRKVQGENADWDAKMIPALQMLVQIEMQQSSLEQAEVYQNKINQIRIGKEQENLNSPDLADSDFEMARLLVAKGQPAEAEKLLKNRLALLLDGFDAGHERVQAARFELANFYIRQGRFQNAREVAREIYDLAVTGLPDDYKAAEQPQLRPALALLVKVEDLDRAPAEAAPWRTKLTEIDAQWQSLPADVGEEITDFFAVASGLAVRLSFLTVAIWWALFSLPLMIRVKDQHASDNVPILQAIREGAGEVVSTFKEIRKLRVAFLFLLAYWFYIDGVDTIIAMAVGYGSSIGIGTGALIGSLLMVQFIAIPFALLFGWGGQKHGPKTWILIGIGIYVLITFYASFYLDARSFFGIVPKFLVLAAMVGMAQGGVQALSRSLFARLIPEDRSAEFFGFYNMIGKFAAFIGPALMGYVGQLAKDPRMGILAIVILFAIGGTLLLFVDTKAGHKLAEELEGE